MQGVQQGPKGSVVRPKGLKARGTPGECTVSPFSTSEGVWGSAVSSSSGLRGEAVLLYFKCTDWRLLLHSMGSLQLEVICSAMRKGSVGFFDAVALLIGSTDVRFTCRGFESWLGNIA